jgi:hypothetical protein
MASDTGPDTPPNLVAAYGALAGAAAVVTLVTFAVSFHGIFDLLLHIARLPWYLAALGPFGVDFFALVGIAASFVMRHEHWRRRAYALLVTLAALAMSVAGNAVDAQARHLPLAGIVALALSPVVVWLSSHLMVVARRSMEERRRETAAQTAPDPEPEIDDEEEQPDMVAAERPFDPQRYARRRRKREVSCATIAAELAERGHKVSDRTVARWTKDVVVVKTAVPDLEGAPA